MLKNQRGVSLVSLMCVLAFGGVLYTFVILPVTRFAMMEDKANLVIGLAVHEATVASRQFHQRTGLWPTTKEQVTAVVHLMRVEFVNPYNGGHLEFGLGRPKNSYDVSSGAIRFIPTADSTNTTVSGYGSHGRLIKETLCLTLEPE